jgi:hypothetical protein
MALQNDSTISTTSEGREPLRHVVVVPAGARPMSAQSSGGNGGGRGYGRGGFGGNRGSGSGNGGSGRGGGFRGNR